LSMYAERQAQVSPKARGRLIWSGLPTSEVERTRGVRLVVALEGYVAVTVEHMLRRRAWA
jgi:hypothetical protein